MSKRALVIALILGGLAFIASSTSPASAQGPVASATTYIDNQWHTIGSGAVQSYAFNRADDHTAVTVTLFNGVALGLAFNVYAPDKNDAPIGRGTSSNVICNTNGDKCASPDLTWAGGASSPGRYTVQVINNGSNATGFLLTLTGGATPVPTYTYYYPPYVVPYAPPYVPPYYMAPYIPPYVPPYLPPYYGPGYVSPYRPYCPPGYFYPPYNYGPWACR